MASQSSYRSKFFHLVIEEYDIANKKHITEQDLFNYCDKELRFTFYAFILHDLDKDIDGRLERKHYHLIVICNQAYSKNTLIGSVSSSLMCNRDIISVRKCTNFVSSVRYLIHCDDKNKIQYEDKDIWTNDINEVNLCIYERSSSLTITIDYLYLLIQSSNTLSEVYTSLGLEKSKLYRSLIIDLWKECHPYGYYD